MTPVLLLISACFWTLAYLVAGVPGLVVMATGGFVGEVLLFGSAQLGDRRRG